MTVQEIKDILHQRGLKATAPRLQIMQVLQQVDHPLTPTMVYTLVKEQFESAPDPVSIYRVLEELQKRQIIVNIPSTGRNSFYCLTGRESIHAHGYCGNCEQMRCLPQVEAPVIQSSFAGQQVHVVAEGLCENCTQGR